MVASGLGNHPVLLLVDGTEPGGGFGYAVEMVPDLSGDGLADLLIGAPFSDLYGVLDTGPIQAYSGTGGLLFQFDGYQSGDQMGFSVGSADVNAVVHSSLGPVTQQV